MFNVFIVSVDDIDFSECTHRDIYYRICSFESKYLNLENESFIENVLDWFHRMLPIDCKFDKVCIFIEQHMLKISWMAIGCLY